MSDFSQRFIFQDTDIRGEVVSVEDSYRQILANHSYPAVVESLLGEFISAAVLLGSTIKFDGSLSMQVKSEGEIPLLMVEITHDGDVRAIARNCSEAVSDDFQVLLANGTLAITIEPKNGQRYQGIVPLEGENLSACLVHYFAQSEQLKTSIHLAANGQRSCGVLIQQLPVDKTPDADEREQQWQHILTLIDTVKRSELLELDSNEMLYRLFHEENTQLFTPAPIQFNCSCSIERVKNAVATIGEEEARSVLAESGVIEMNCDFCNTNYQLGCADVDDVFTKNDPTIH
ncbi:33 kDa chaperonin [Sinobacterium norvegicum]|uniref:33 kDa chaperonin n=1 Tax=Sinobacterium norvegicum TaxID=1641715 RepID=A0ABN8ERL2_9GAMM|nr:Hsp33 family molecular chaperone HslO [Sinobacterium norvegicum]CAH0992906.1 33 kDa chaperonin [Sinobacterium norvegicum]